MCIFITQTSQYLHLPHSYFLELIIHLSYSGFVFKTRKCLSERSDHKSPNCCTGSAWVKRLPSFYFSSTVMSKAHKAAYHDHLFIYTFFLSRGNLGSFCIHVFVGQCQMKYLQVCKISVCGPLVQCCVQMIDKHWTVSGLVNRKYMQLLYNKSKGCQVLLSFYKVEFVKVEDLLACQR